MAAGPWFNKHCPGIQKQYFHGTDPKIQQGKITHFFSGDSIN